MRANGFLLGCIAAAVMLSALPAQATDTETEALQAKLDLLQARLDRLETQRGTAIQKEEMAQLMEEILEDAKAAPSLPKWMEDLRFYGDLRLRYQHDSRGWRDTGYGDHTRKDRSRARFRLRFGVTKTWWDKQLEVGFRLASGSSSDSDSTNQTFDGAFSKKQVWIDLAYAKYAPNCIDGLTIIGGKMKNPIRTKTFLSWDGDINPEGFVADYQAPFFGDFKPYVGAGYMILDENSDGDDVAGRDATMYFWSAGFDWKIADSVKTFVGGTYYQYDDVNGIAGGWDDTWTGADYEVLELTAKVGGEMLDLPFSVWGTFLHNCADDYEGSGVYEEFGGEDNAYGIGMTVGRNKKKGDWSASYSYAHIEAHSVPMFGGGFGLSDSDFGGPNRKGHVIKGAYNLDDFLTVGGAVLVTDPIHDVMGSNQGEDHTVTVQFDVIWKF